MDVHDYGRRAVRLGRFALTLLALPVATVAVGAHPNKDDEAVYNQRFETMVKGGGIMFRYDPMEPVQGAQAPAPLPVAAPATRSISAAALDKAAAYAAANNSSAFIVWRDGAVQRADYYAGMTRDSQMVSKSLSKPLSAIAVGRAIALGKIASLDQPVADFILEWKGTPKAGILVRHLLDMRSGLLEQMVSNDPNHPINRVYIGTHHDDVLVHDYPLTHAPGTHYGYSNATADMVALLIERATGKRYADFVGQELLTPIDAAGGEIWVDRPGGLAHSGCCMTLPAESWLKLGLLLLDDGVARGQRLLPTGYVAAMTHGTRENPHYGLGVWLAGPYIERRGFSGDGKPGPKVLHGAPYADKDLFLFDGNGDQVVYISRATRMIALRLGDQPPSQPEWDNSVIPNLLIGGIVHRPGEVAPAPQPRP